MLWCVELQKPSKQLIQMSSPRWSTNFLPKWTRSSDKRENESHQSLKLQRVLLHANVPSAPPKLSPSKYLQPPTHTPPHRSCSLMKSIGVSSKYEGSSPSRSIPYMRIHVWSFTYFWKIFIFYTYFFLQSTLGETKIKHVKSCIYARKTEFVTELFLGKIAQKHMFKKQLFFTKKVVNSRIRAGYL